MQGPRRAAPNAASARSSRPSSRLALPVRAVGGAQPPWPSPLHGRRRWRACRRGSRSRQAPPTPQLQARTPDHSEHGRRQLVLQRVQHMLLTIPELVSPNGPVAHLVLYGRWGSAWTRDGGGLGLTLRQARLGAFPGPRRAREGWATAWHAAACRTADNVPVGCRRATAAALPPPLWPAPPIICCPAAGTPRAAAAAAAQRSPALRACLNALPLPACRAACSCCSGLYHTGSDMDLMLVGGCFHRGEVVPLVRRRPAASSPVRLSMSCLKPGPLPQPPHVRLSVPRQPARALRR
jgi:hypothetical protein